MAQVTYQAAGTGSNTTGNPTPGYPAGLAANDLILLQVLVGDITNTPTTPTGFTLLYGPDAMTYSTGFPRSWIYGKISDGTESGNLTVTCSGTAEKAARMYSFRNNALSSYNESGGWASGAADPVPMQNVTTSVNEGLAVAFVSLLTISENPGNATGETGGDWTEAVAEYEAGSVCLQLQIATMATAGTISGGSINLSTSRYYGVRAFGIKPASGATHEVSITESATATEVVNSSGNIFTASETEAATATESPDASRIMPVSITEVGTATEASDRLLTMAASIIEAGTATEASDRLFIALALITEAATAIETNSGLTTAIASITEAVTALDESNFLGAIYEVEITETGTATDSQSALITLVASILEAITAEDTHNALRTTIAAIIEANAADDLSSVANVMVAGITETATAEDILSSALIIAAGIIESGIPLDSLDSVKIAVASIIEAGLSTDSMDATLISSEVEVGGFGNIEYERRKREKERFKAILAEDEELIAMVASFMEVITKRWVH